MHLSTLFTAPGLAAGLYFTVALCLGIAPFCALLHFFFPAAEQRLIAFLIRPSGIALLATTLLSTYALVAALVLSFPGYVDPCEPMIIAESHFLTHHVPVYDIPIAYGPYCFLPFALASSLFGESLAPLKGILVVGNVALFASVFAVFRKRINVSAALAITGLVLIAFLMKQDYVFQIRGDLFIYVAVALGLLAALSESLLLAVLLLTVALTIAIGVKITAALYFLYPLVLFYRRHGSKGLALVGVLTSCLSLAPFIISTLTLPAYLHWLHAMAKQPRSSKEFAGNLLTASILLVPVLLTVVRYLNTDRRKATQYLLRNMAPISALLIGMLLTAVLSAKFGAGRHHLIPFAMLTAYLAVDLHCAVQTSTQRETSFSIPGAYSWGLIGFLLFSFGVSEAASVWSLTHRERLAAIDLHNDVNQILRRYPKSRLELGPGIGQFDLDSKYSAIYAAPQLVFAGDPYNFDLSSEADRELMKAPVPEKMFDYIRTCKADYWLIPLGEHPFETMSIYSGMYPGKYPKHQLFQDDLRQTFHQAYVYSSSSRFFDLYVCRNPETAGPI